MKIIKLRSAWIITWVWASDSQAKVDEFAGILNYRKSTNYVKSIVESLYALNSFNLVELASFAKNQGNNPYRATINKHDEISCGSHPALFARKVKNIEVFRDINSGFETITWETAPKYELEDNILKKITDSSKCKITRIQSGPLSFDLRS